jgi:hypothetical protein
MSLVVRFAPTGLTKAKYDSTLEKIKAAPLQRGEQIEVSLGIGVAPGEIQSERREFSAVVQAKAGLASRGGEGLCVDPQFHLWRETEDAISQDQDSLRVTLTDRTERNPSNVQCLVEVVHAGVQRAFRPQLLDDLLAVESVARG